MQQSHLTTYADIAEVRAVTGTAACNQLLAEGWVLLGVYPLTTVAEITEGRAGGEETIIVNQSNVHGVFLFFAL
jgi:hypothetical protein